MVRRQNSTDTHDLVISHLSEHSTTGAAGQSIAQIQLRPKTEKHSGRRTWKDLILSGVWDPYFIVEWFMRKRRNHNMKEVIELINF